MNTFFGRAAILSLAVAASGSGVIPTSTAFAQSVTPGAMAIATDASAYPQEHIDPYRPRFGRRRPLIAVVGLNEGTEITDFIVPFGVLSRSGTADVISVAVRPGVVNMRPLQVELQSTLAEFDKRYPDGADYVVVPATSNNADANLVRWVSEQGGKGGTIVSICLGAMVVANSGLMDGHRATSYFANEVQRMSQYPKVHWLRNIRYVADGKIVSSAGISASIPISIALVEAIAGRDKATAIANELGITDWSSRHNSDTFQRKPGDQRVSTRDQLPQEAIGIPVKAGDDEIALGLTAEAYSMTGRSKAFVLSPTDAPITLAHGLVVIPGKVLGRDEPVARTLPALTASRSARYLDIALEDIATVYGRERAANVAQFMEYPEYER